MSFKRNELLTASEVARYVYCKRAWSYDRIGKIREQRKPNVAGILTIFSIITVVIITGWMLS